MNEASFSLSTELESKPDIVWAAVERPTTFLYVAAPLVVFTTIGAKAFPEKWAEQEYKGSMKLFGIFPLGWQAISITFPRTQGPVRELKDNGYGPLLKRWEHLISVRPEGQGTRYTDRITLDAGILTPIVRVLVKQFFLHRQRRLRRLDRSGFVARP